MVLSIAVLLLAQAAPAQNDELLRAAKNPYDLARFIDSHLGFDWSVLWNALGTKGTMMQPCGKLSDGRRGCSTEVIGVQNPDQAIVLVAGDATPADAYIRYLRQRNGSWQFSGVQEAFIRNHPRRHQVDRSIGTPFLRISSQGIYGSGIDSEVEVWYDLTKEKFEPVFRFAVQGSQRRLDAGLGRHVTATIIPEKESIHVALTVTFMGEDHPAEYDLGMAQLTGIFRQRTPGGAYVLESAYTDTMQNIATADFESLSNIEQNPPAENLVRLDLYGLTEVATGKDTAAKNWLRDLLNRCKDTPEVRKLKSLLQK